MNEQQYVAMLERIASATWYFFNAETKDERLVHQVKVTKALEEWDNRLGLKKEDQR